MKFIKSGRPLKYDTSKLNKVGDNVSFIIGKDKPTSMRASIQKTLKARGIKVTAKQTTDGMMHVEVISCIS